MTSLKDHSNGEKENPLPPMHGLLFQISSKGSFTLYLQDSTYQGLCCNTNCGALTGMRNSSVDPP